MKIIGVEIENYKNLTDVKLTNLSDVNEIVGENAAGKSALIEAIQFALMGKVVFKNLPIKLGAKKAAVNLKLGESNSEYIIDRVIRYNNKMDLVVVNKDEPQSSPQAIINDLVGSANILSATEIIDGDGKKQFKIILETLGKLDEFNALKTQEEMVFNKRKDSNADLLKLRKQLPDIKPVDPQLTDEDIDSESIQLELAELNEVGYFVNGSVTKIQAAKTEIETLNSLIAEYKEKIKKAQERQNQLNDSVSKLKGEVDVVVEEYPDIKAEIKTVSDKLANITKNIQKKTEYDNYQFITDAISQEETVNEKLNIELSAVRDKIQQLKTAGDLGIEDVEVTEDGILYKGVPLAEVNESQRAVIGMMINIKLMPKDGIRVVFFKDGHKFSPVSKQKLYDMCREAGVQVFLETIIPYKNESGKLTPDYSNASGIVLKDGELQEEN